MTDGGKGSKPRPFSVTQDKFSDNWDKIFNKKKKSKNKFANILPDGAPVRRALPV